MNRQDPVNIMANLVVIAGFVPIVLFVLFYGLRSKWRATLVGRSLMYQSMALLLVMTVVLVGIWWPDMPGRPTFRLVAYLLMVITMWRMFITLLWYQRQWDNAQRLVAEISKPIVQEQD